MRKGDAKLSRKRGMEEWMEEKLEVKER